MLQVATNMPKLVGLMACGPAVFLIGFQGAKFARNYNSTGEIHCSQSSAHKIGIVDRLCAGPSPVISKASEQMLDRLLSTIATCKDPAITCATSAESQSARGPAIAS